MVQLILFIFALNIVGNAFAFPTYNPGAFGEQDFIHYSKSDWPLYQSDPYDNNISWNDDLIEKNYINNLWGKPFTDLEDFLEKRILQSMNCPDEQISEHFEYLQYVHRLLNISYIFESLKGYDLDASKMGLNQKSCQINWQELFKNCAPSSIYMKQFLQNVDIVISQLPKVVVSSDISKNEYKSNWLKSFLQKKFEHVSHYRFSEYCKSRNCDLKNESKLTQSFSDICLEDQKRILNICSERDLTYGMYKISQAYHLISNSNILNSINNKGFANGCLRRFSKQMRNKEKIDPVLKAIYPILFKMISNDPNNSYLQGRLFVAGSMREFLDKGISQVFKQNEINPPVKIDKKVALEISETKKIEKKKEIAKKETVKNEIKKTVVLKTNKDIKLPTKSSFLIASEFRKKFDLENAKVDMQRFKYDYIFTIDIANAMNKSLESFMQLKAIEEMKKFDNLGSINGPVPLIFIKYMIDQEHHQGLFNLVNTLGQQFYVRNNIDEIANDSVQFIELKNDSSTNHEWQILIKKIK